MSKRTEKFSTELKRLVNNGDMLYMAIQGLCDREALEEALESHFDGDSEKIKKYLKDLPDFRSDYQAWYSKAQAVIKQVLPDRLSDFISYYEYPRVRKDITFQNYMIRDLLQGLRITSGGGYEVIADASAAIPEFQQQLSIVKAAYDTLDSTLLDLKEVLQADLFDTEIDAAQALAKAGHLRASGAICGVVLEKHLQHVCDMHNITIRKKHPGISDLNQAIKDAGITSTAQWRFVQSLADIRNMCDHAKGREPTKQEIEDLVLGAGKIIKTVF